MQIKIEIEVKPEELRRFLGLPDVAGLQEDIVHFLRDKLGAASENFDPASFVKENFQTLRNSSAWRRIVAAAKVRTAGGAAAEPEGPAEPKRRPRKPAAKGRKPAARRRARNSGAAATPAPAEKAASGGDAENS